MIAQLIYWFPLDDSGLRDGGSHRAHAWRTALEQLGYEVVVTPIHQGAATVGNPKSGVLHRAKRALLPMPLPRRVRVIEEASVVVATVPAVFASVEESAAARQAVIFDWTDLWSSAASTFEGQGMASFGARTQAARWRKRERTLSRAPVARTFAGFADAETLLGVRGGDSWLPTPVTGHTRCAPQPEMAGGRRLGFIANLHYAPNRISLDKFLGDFGARLSGIGSRLVVAGPGSAEVDDPFGVVEPLGVVRRVEDFYQSIDAAVVPVEVGGGIKVKAIEALAHGVPVYGTRHVAEGFPPSLRPHISSLETLFDATHVPSMMPSEVWSSYFSVSAFNAGVARAVSVAGAARREVD